MTITNISFVISVTVIACMAITFASLFFLYGRAKSKSVKFGAEDEAIKRGLNADLKKFKTKSYTQAFAKRKKKERVVRIVTDVLFALVILAVGAATALAVVLRIKGQQIYLGGTTYVTVLTSSMQTKNENNEFLKEHDDGVRISQYALIGIDKAEPSALEEGDIIAFKYDDEKIFVHRIVSIKTSDGARTFTTMGDANSSSSFNERDITEDRIIGVYNGFNAKFAGVMLIYLRSNIGLVTLIFVFLLLGAIDISSSLATRTYEKRQKTLASQLDGGKAKNGGAKQKNYDYEDNYKDNYKDDYKDDYEDNYKDEYNYDYDDRSDEYDYDNYGDYEYDNDFDDEPVYEELIDENGFEPGDGFSDYADIDDDYYD